MEVVEWKGRRLLRDAGSGGMTAMGKAGCSAPITSNRVRRW
jgi:hypothetical protein